MKETLDADRVKDIETHYEDTDDDDIIFHAKPKKMVKSSLTEVDNSSFMSCYSNISSFARKSGPNEKGSFKNIFPMSDSTLKVNVPSRAIGGIGAWMTRQSSKNFDDEKNKGDRRDFQLTGQVCTPMRKVSDLECLLQPEQVDMLSNFMREEEKYVDRLNNFLELLGQVMEPELEPFMTLIRQMVQVSKETIKLIKDKPESCGIVTTFAPKYGNYTTAAKKDKDAVDIYLEYADNVLQVFELLQPSNKGETLIDDAATLLLAPLNRFILYRSFLHELPRSWSGSNTPSWKTKAELLMRIMVPQVKRILHKFNLGPDCFEKAIDWENKIDTSNCMDIGAECARTRPVTLYMSLPLPFAKEPFISPPGITQIYTFEELVLKKRTKILVKHKKTRQYHLNPKVSGEPLDFVLFNDMLMIVRKKAKKGKQYELVYPPMPLSHLEISLLDYPPTVKKDGFDFVQIKLSPFKLIVAKGSIDDIDDLLEAFDDLKKLTDCVPSTVTCKKAIMNMSPLPASSKHPGTPPSPAAPGKGLKKPVPDFHREVRPTDEAKPKPKKLFVFDVNGQKPFETTEEMDEPSLVMDVVCQPWILKNKEWEKLSKCQCMVYKGQKSEMDGQRPPGESNKFIKRHGWMNLIVPGTRNSLMKATFHPLMQISVTTGERADLQVFDAKGCLQRYIIKFKTDLIAQNFVYLVSQQITSAMTEYVQNTINHVVCMSPMVKLDPVVGAASTLPIIKEKAYFSNVMASVQDKANVWHPLGRTDLAVVCVGASGVEQSTMLLAWSKLDRRLVTLSYELRPTSNSADKVTESLVELSIATENATYMYRFHFENSIAADTFIDTIARLAIVAREKARKYRAFVKSLTVKDTEVNEKAIEIVEDVPIVVEDVLIEHEPEMEPLIADQEQAPLVSELSDTTLPEEDQAQPASQGDEENAAVEAQEGVLVPSPPSIQRPGPSSHRVRVFRKALEDSFQQSETTIPEVSSTPNLWELRDNLKSVSDQRASLHAENQALVDELAVQVDEQQRLKQEDAALRSRAPLQRVRSSSSVQSN